MTHIVCCFGDSVKEEQKAAFWFQMSVHSHDEGNKRGKPKGENNVRPLGHLR
jgi:hypothetical protein